MRATIRSELEHCKTIHSALLVVILAAVLPFTTCTWDEWDDWTVGLDFRDDWSTGQADNASGIRLNGTVTAAADSSAIPNARVTAYVYRRWGDYSHQSTGTDGQGHYTLYLKHVCQRSQEAYALS